MGSTSMPAEVSNAGRSGEQQAAPAYCQAPGHASNPLQFGGEPSHITATAPQPPPPHHSFQHAQHQQHTSAHGPPNPLTQPRELLEFVLNQVVATDKEKYFVNPVDESQAPGYYSIIKNPMCFADMRLKLAKNEYTSYRAIMADFELIISNAKTFNTNKTRCHKCAVALHRNVNRIMTMYELDVRKACSMLHPHASSLPAAGITPPPAARPFSAGRGAVSTSDLTSAASGSAHATPQPGDTTDGGAAAAGTATDSAVVLSTGPGSMQAQMLTQLVTTAAATLGRPSMPLPPIPPAPIQLDPLCKVYSDDEDEVQAALKQSQRQAQDQQGAQTVNASLQTLVPFEQLMAQLRQGAVFQPWEHKSAYTGQAVPKSEPVNTAHGPSGLPQATSQQAQTALCNGQAPTAVNQQQDTEMASAPADQAGNDPSQQQPQQPAEQQQQQQLTKQTDTRTRAWRSSSRSIEWQCHWLELRMCELQSQIERLSKAGPAHGEQMARADGDQAAASGGSSSAVAADLQKRQQRLQAAVSRYIQPPSHTAGASTEARQTKSEVSQHIPPLTSSIFFLGDNKCRTAVSLQQHPADIKDKIEEPTVQASQPPEEVQPNVSSDMQVDQPATIVTTQPAGTSSQATAATQEPVPAPITPIDIPMPLFQIPAAVYSTLEALEIQLADIKRGLTTAFQLDKGVKTRAAAARTAAPNAGLHQTPANALVRKQSSMRALPMRAGSMIGHAGSSKLGLLHPYDSKRKRVDMEGEGSLLAPMASAQPKVIVIPPVRELPQEELIARQEATITWADAYRLQGEVALSHPPQAVEAVLPSDEGSSSEDSGDEAYVAMHEVMAEEERKKFAEWAAEGQRRRTKQGSQAKPGGTSAGGAADKNVTAGGHAKPSRVRSTAGIKAPRMSGVGGASAHVTPAGTPLPPLPPPSFATPVHKTPDGFTPHHGVNGDSREHTAASRPSMRSATDVHAQPSPVPYQEQQQTPAGPSPAQHPHYISDMVSVPTNHPPHVNPVVGAPTPPHPFLATATPHASSQIPTISIPASGVQQPRTAAAVTMSVSPSTAARTPTGVVTIVAPPPPPIRTSASASLVPAPIPPPLTSNAGQASLGAPSGTTLAAQPRRRGRPKRAAAIIASANLKDCAATPTSSLPSSSLRVSSTTPGSTPGSPSPKTKETRQRLASDGGHEADSKHSRGTPSAAVAAQDTDMQIDKGGDEGEEDARSHSGKQTELQQDGAANGVPTTSRPASLNGQEPGDGAEEGLMTRMMKVVQTTLNGAVNKIHRKSGSGAPTSPTSPPPQPPSNGKRRTVIGTGVSTAIAKPVTTPLKTRSQDHGRTRSSSANGVSGGVKKPTSVTRRNW